MRRSEAEKSIRLENVFAYVLRRYKLILLCTVIMAAVFGVGRYVSDRNSYNLQTSVKTEETELSEEQTAQVEQAVQLKNQMQENEEYLKTSVLMQIDPYNASAVTLLYYISGEGDVDTAAIANAYQYYVKAGAFNQDIMDEFPEVESERDLYGIVSATVETGQRNTNENGQEGNQAVLSVEVRYTDAEGAEKIAGIVDKNLVEYADRLRISMGEYGLSLLDTVSRTGVDENLLSMRFNTESIAIKLQETYNALTDDFSDEQMALLEGAEKKTENAVINPPHVSIAAIVGGGVVGAFVAVFIAIFSFLLTEKVLTFRELQDASLTVLGAVRAKKERENAIDKKIGEWEEQKYADRNVTFKSLASTVQRRMEKACGTKLWLVGSLSQERMVYMEKIREELQNRGITAAVASTLAEAAEEEEIKGGNAAVLVTEMGYSKTGDINYQLEYMETHDITVLGTVVLY